MGPLEQYYEEYDEDGRLLLRHGQVEYLTTMRCIKECIALLASPDGTRHDGHMGPSILEVGAGTGRYSVTLAKEGFHVTAVELVPHNLDLLRAKLDGTEPIVTMRGDARDLSALADSSFDLTLVLGPMYHLYTREDKLRALSEAVRVTRPGGHILVAYCMNDPAIVRYVFEKGHLWEVLDGQRIDSDWRLVSNPAEIFELVRVEEIDDLDSELPVERLRLVATDGMTNHYRALIDSMDDDAFAQWMEYHFSVCERQDMIGVSHHTLDVLRKLPVTR